MKNKIYFIALFLFCFQSYGKFTFEDIDSLNNVLKQKIHDTTRININLELANLYRFIDVDTAFIYQKNAEKLALEIKSDYKYAKSIEIKGLLYSLISDFNNAEKYYDKAIFQYDLLNKEKEKIDVLYSRSIVIYYKGDSEGAIKGFFTALEMYEKLNIKTEAANCLISLSNVYGRLNNSEKEFEYLKRGFQMKKELNDKNGLTTCYINMSKYFKKTLQLDSAIYYCNIGLKLAEEINNLKWQFTASANLGSYYSEKSDFDNGLLFFNKAKNLANKLNDKQSQCSVAGNIGILYLSLKDYKSAKSEFDFAYQLAREIGDLNQISIAYYNYFDFFKEQNNFEKALDYYQRHINVKDSIFNKESLESINEISTKYETEKKEQEIVLLNKEKELKDSENKRQKVVIYITLSSIVVFIILIILVYRQYEAKKKTNKDLIIAYDTIELKNEKIETAYRNITDSINYAQKIQSALLPNEDVFRNVLLHSFILFKPKDIVSGDFYWLSDREDYVFYATADSTGHGVPGGFMSMLGTALLNEIIDERKVKDCGEALTLMREKIMQALKQTGDSESKDGMDMVLIRINKNTLEMQYAAANNSLYIVSNKQSAIGNDYCLLQTANCKIFELPCDKMPVGVYHSEVKPFQTFNFQLQKGDTIYTYTDGYADQFGGEKGKKYTYKRLREKLLAISQEPLEEQKISLENDFEIWKGENEQIDDVCLIGVRV